jgi:hypothetical protein
MIDQKENSAHLISDQSVHNFIRRFLLVLPTTNIVTTPPHLEIHLVRFREIYCFQGQGATYFNIKL